MTTAELAWVAGIVEGEGCFSMDTRQARKKGGKVYINIRVAMVDEDVVRKLHKISGVGTVLGPILSPSRAEHNYQPLYIWAVQKQKDAAALMMTLYPLMGIRRQAKITECLAAWRA